MSDLDNILNIENMFVFGVVFHRVTNPLKYTISKLVQSNRNLVILLLDKKADDCVYREIKEYTKKMKNVVFSPRISVDWARFSLIEAPLLLMRLALSYQVKYFSLISGDDILISSNQEMHSFLDKSYEKKYEFIGVNRDTNKYSLANPYLRLCIDYPEFFYDRYNGNLHKLKKLISFLFLYVFSRKNIGHLPTLYKGCNWFTISDKAIKYIFRYIDKNPYYIDAFKGSYCGDEVFFQTILFNSKFKESIYHIDGQLKDCEMALRFIDWESGPDFPKIFREENFHEIKESNMLFARKVQSDISIELIKETFL